ncbi:hypothetical protein WICPIJ_008616, partial [Wickerhamomyces pijperi]
MLNKHSSLPYSKKNSEGTTWISFDDYKKRGDGAKCKGAEYAKLKQTLVRLDSIDPQLKSQELEEILNSYKVSKSKKEVIKKVKELDSKGRAVAVG